MKNMQKKIIDRPKTVKTEALYGPIRLGGVAHHTRLSGALENPDAPLRRPSGALGFSNTPAEHLQF